MATQVRETAAGKSISAYVVLNKKGEHVATVNAHFSNGGRVTVDVWNHGAALAACFKAAKPGLSKASQANPESSTWSLFCLQQGTASGYGYDKFAASIRGLWIDGIQLTDHCGRDAASEKLLAQYQRAAAKHEVRETIENHTLKISYAFPEGFHKEWDRKAAKMGASFANFNGGKYQSLHISAGLKRLEEMGYRVIQAI